MAIYNISAGHNPDGKIACGTVNKTLDMKESTEARYLTKKVVEYLNSDGHDARDCTVNNGTGQGDVLDKLKSKHNSRKADLQVSIHFNDTSKKDYKGDKKNIGSEVWIYSRSSYKSELIKIGNTICKNLHEIGFKNRGIKESGGLRFLKETKGKSLLIETCFCCDRDDVELYKKNRDNVARAIANGIEKKSYKKGSVNMKKSVGIGIVYEGEVDKVSAMALKWKWKKEKVELIELKDVSKYKIEHVYAVGLAGSKIKSEEPLTGKDRVDTLQKVIAFLNK